MGRESTAATKGLSFPQAMRKGTAEDLRKEWLSPLGRGLPRRKGLEPARQPQSVPGRACSISRLRLWAGAPGGVATIPSSRAEGPRGLCGCCSPQGLGRASHRSRSCPILPCLASGCSPGSLKARVSHIYLIKVCQYLKRGCQEAGARPCWAVPSNGTRGKRRNS